MSKKSGKNADKTRENLREAIKEHNKENPDEPVPESFADSFLKPHPDGKEGETTVSSAYVRWGVQPERDRAGDKPAADGKKKRVCYRQVAVFLYGVIQLSRIVTMEVFGLMSTTTLSRPRTWFMKRTWAIRKVTEFG